MEYGEAIKRNELAIQAGWKVLHDTLMKKIKK